MTTKRRSARGPRARRAKGTGSITRYTTKSGTRWRYDIDVPIDPGRPDAGTRRRTRGGFTGFEEANDELTLVLADVIRKVPQPAGRDTFGAYAQRWLDGHSCGNGTRIYIQRVIDAMHPYIGALCLSDIRASDLAAAYRGLERGTKQAPSPKRPRQGLATSTVARYANWVNTIFLAALDEGLIIKNPANSRHAGRPKGETAKRVKPFVIWNVEQLTRFCDWATAEDEPWAVARRVHLSGMGNHAIAEGTIPAVPLGRRVLIAVGPHLREDREVSDVSELRRSWLASPWQATRVADPLRDTAPELCSAGSTPGTTA